MSDGRIVSGDWWLQARFTTTDGEGVGRWRNYFRCEDMADVNFRVRDLVKSCQIRVVTVRRRGRPQEVIVPPQRASEYLASLEPDPEPSRSIEQLRSMGALSESETSIYELIEAVRQHPKYVAVCVFTTDDLEDDPLDENGAIEKMTTRESRKAIEEAMTRAGFETIEELTA